MELRAFFIDPANKVVTQIGADHSIFLSKVGACALASITVWKTGCDDDFSLDDEDGFVVVMIDDFALSKHAKLSWDLPAPTYRKSYTFHGPAVVVLEGGVGVNAEDTYGSVGSLRQTIGW